MKKNSCTPINPKKYSCCGLKKIHTRNLITKNNSCGSKIPLPPHKFSNGPSLRSYNFQPYQVLSLKECKEKSFVCTEGWKLFEFSPYVRVRTPDSRTQEIEKSGRFLLVAQSVIFGFGIRNPTDDRNSIYKVRNPVPGIRNPRHEIQNPKLYLYI